MPVNRNHRLPFFTRTTAAITCTLGVLWFASRNASAGIYLADCLHRLSDPVTAKTSFAVDTSKDNPTKCCKIDDNGNIDYEDCGGVVIVKNGYWCVKGDDYVGVYCKANPDGNSETCTDHPSAHKNPYTPTQSTNVTNLHDLGCKLLNAAAARILINTQLCALARPSTSRTLCHHENQTLDTPVDVCHLRMRNNACRTSD